MEYGLALIILIAVVTLVVIRPVVYREDDAADVDATRAELEAAKEAKYREIRDAELDLQMGKLSREDHRAVDRELRAEAIDILAGWTSYTARRPAPDLRYPPPAMEAILSGVQVVLSVVLIVLILLHSGKDTGLSGAFGVGGGAGPLGGGRSSSATSTAGRSDSPWCSWRT